MRVFAAIRFNKHAREERVDLEACRFDAENARKAARRDEARILATAGGAAWLELNPLVSIGEFELTKLRDLEP